MKNIYTLLFVGFLSSNIFAQNLNFTNWTDTIYGLSTDWEITSHEMDVVNTSGNNLSLKVKKNELVTVNTTGYYFCWGPTCQNVDDTISSETVNINSGDTNSTFINYARISSDNSNSGISKVEYCFFDVNNTISDFCISQYFNVAYVSGVNSIKENEDKIKIYYSNELMNVSSEINPIKNIKVYDINGKLVSAQTLLNPSNYFSFQFNENTSGVYFVKATLSNDKTVGKKLIFIK